VGPSRKKLTVLMPCLNDSKSLKSLCLDLHTNLAAQDYFYKIVISDDGSSPSELASLREFQSNSENIILLEGKYKTGHQSAILRGLDYIAKNLPSDVVVMDSDGEDMPSHVLILLKKINSVNARIILAKRGHRYSGFKFVLLYKLFNLPFRALTGHKLQTGNFMAISEEWVPWVTQLPSVNNHVSASILRYCPNIDFVTLDRGIRYFGKSKMNLASLSLHGYGALAVYADLALSRLVIGVSAFGLSLLSASLILVVLKFTTDVISIPGWTSILVLQLFSLSIITLLQAITSTLVILWNKKNRKNHAE